MALYILLKLILQTNMRSHPVGLIFGRTLLLLPYSMCANSEGSRETVRMPAQAHLSLCWSPM